MDRPSRTVGSIILMYFLSYTYLRIDLGAKDDNPVLWIASKMTFYRFHCQYNRLFCVFYGCEYTNDWKKWWRFSTTKNSSRLSFNSIHNS